MSGGAKKWAEGPSDARVFFANFVAHGGALIGGKLVGAPLDRVKLLLQVNRDRGFIDVCRTTYSQGGIRSFYRGMKSHVGSVAIGLPLRLSFYRTAQLLHSDHKSSLPHRFVYHLASSWATLGIIYPLDVQYTRIAADMNAKPHSSLFKAVFQERSVSASLLYRGFSLCLVTSIPYLAVSLATHDALRRRFLAGFEPTKADFRHVQPSVEELTRESMHLFPYNLLCGIAAGMVAQSVVYPLDTVRRRYMTDITYTSWWVCLQEGLRNRLSLFSGFTVNAVKLFPEAGALCVGYYYVHTYVRYRSS